MQRVNKTTFSVTRISKKQYFETDSSASSGGGGKYVKYLTFFGLRLRQHCQFLTLAFSVKKKKQFF